MILVTKNTFGWIDFKITNRCNNNCVYCGVTHDSPNFHEIIPIEAITNTLDQAINFGFNFFAFLGGEPSIRQNVTEIFTPFSDEGNLCHLLVITNMQVFHKELYRALFNTRAISAYLVASIDRMKSPNFKNQDFDRILSNLARIRKIANEFSHLGTRGVQIHSVISRENHFEFGELIKFCSLNTIPISLAMVEPLKIVANKPKKYNEFTRDELIQIIKKLGNLNTQYKLEFPNIVLLDYLDDYLTRQLKMAKCMAGKEHVIIESDGQVYPCLTESYRKGLSFGNIIQEEFQEIYKRMNNFRCQNPFNDTCWDHYLWNRLGEHIRRE